MDYSDTVIVVVTTISAFIIALLLAFLYYIQCIRSRPPSDKNNAIGLDWVKINNLMALKSPAKSFKETTSPDHSEYIYNPSIPNINNTNDNSSSGKSIATSIDVEFGTRYASITSPPHGSSKGSSNTSKISLAVTETKPVNNNKNQSTSSSSASIDNFGSFQFLDPSFASVVSGKSTELDSVLPTPPSSSSSVSTATTTTATNQVRSPPKHEVEVRDSTALTWSRDALLPSVPTISPTPVTTHIITPTVTQPEEDSASVTVPQTENEETPALTETEFNDAMTSKLMPPSAEGPQKFTSGGLIAADIQMSVATNKGLTAAERNTEYFKKIKEHESSSDHMRMAKMDPQQLLNKKIEMELKRAHENKKTSHAARLGSITLRGPSLSFSRNSRLPNSTNVTPRDNNATSIEEGTGQEEDG